MPIKMNNESFIEKAIKIHGYEWDYSLVDYVNTSTKIKIICKKHGIFEQTPNCHLRKRRCPKCHGNMKYTNKTFIEKCEKIWGPKLYKKYDLSLIKYKDNKSPIKIFCKIHNDFFEQRPDMFLQKHGCDFCGGTFKLTTEDFIKKSKLIHGDSIDYSLVDYKGAHIKVKLICQKHQHEFKQKPYRHLSGCGCPICKLSIGEKKIKNYLDNNKIYYISQHTFENCKYKNSLPFDFYLPKYKTCIEFDGIQHYKIVEHFGGKNTLELNKIKDNIKNNYCKINNIKLIRIPYNKIDEIENILKTSFLI